MSDAVEAMKRAVFYKTARDVVRAMQIKKDGASPATQVRADLYAYRYFQCEYGISEANVRTHLRVFDRFGTNDEAIAHFTFSELTLLCARAVEDEHVSALIAVKKQNPGLRRNELKALIAKAVNSGCVV